MTTSHVEQKNRTHVRCLLGYDRIEDEATGLFNNYFCANRKLVFKEKRGAKYYKRYDEPQTPCDRLLKSENVVTPKIHLTEVKLTLDPYKLRTQTDAKQRKILNRLR